MDAVDSLFEQIERGRSGLNIGLNIGLPILQSMTYGVQRQTYTVLAGATGSGKTTLALYSYVYRVVNDHLGDMRYRVVFFSFEMTSEILLAKLLSTYIWETYGVEASYADIMSREASLNDNLYEIVNQCKPWLQKIMKQLTIIDRAIGADAVYSALKGYAARNGSEEIGPNGKITYTPNVEGELVQVIIDHLALVKIQGTRSKKEEMDLLANYMLSIRNIYFYSPLILMQINRTSSSMDRRNAGFQEMELGDLKDTGTAAEAAELVIAVFSPWRVKQAMHKGYNIKVLQDRYRAIQILKSRLGESEKQVSVNFWGSVGIFEELPPSEELARLSDTQLRAYTHLTEIPVDRPNVIRTENESKMIPEGKIVFRF